MNAVVMLNHDGDDAMQIGKKQLKENYL